MRAISALTFALLLASPFTLQNASAQPEREQSPPAMPPIGDILGQLHGGYSVSLMGPRLSGPREETYNIYLPDVSGVQAFHSIQLGYQIRPDLQIGFGESIVQNLIDGVRGESGIVHHRSFDALDPYLYLTLPRLFRIPGWSVYTTATLSLPITDASYDAARITSITLAQSWGLLTGSRWRFGFDVFLNPQFYSDPLPEGFQDRQTFYASFGPMAGYEILPDLLLKVDSRFTVEHRSPDSRGFWDLGSGLPDTARMSLAWAPQSERVYSSVSLYYQTLVWEPSNRTSILGAGMSLGF
ncbi:MAG: hypothetical protein EBX52_05075 [Proteobacteria bacterium]|nr:hypothetical protein [Pseudomonadota bacterium]